jgi:uncharacterized protein (DUF2164 family)
MLRQRPRTTALQICRALTLEFERWRDALRRSRRRLRFNGRRLKPQLANRAFAEAAPFINFAGAVVINTIEISKQAKSDLLASMKRYFDENLDPIGDLPANLLLNYILEEIGPVIYNKAISDAQSRMQQRVTELDGELYAPELEYWPNQEKKRKKK